jgi:hypothetical protein
MVCYMVLICLTGSAQDSIPIPLGGTAIYLLRYGQDTTEVLLFNMHDNENASAAAGQLYAQKFGGASYELVHNGKRNISFAFGKDSIHFDPNRIFTDEGIRQQLKNNRVKDQHAHRMIATWRDTLLALLDLKSRKLVIALHNNTADNYGFESYTPGAEYEREASELFHGQYPDQDEFYFVTDKSHFDSLSAGKYHVVLQDNSAMTDDGSLSVYCAKYDIPYINVEAQHGHLFRQLLMLRQLAEQIVR